MAHLLDYFDTLAKKLKKAQAPLIPNLHKKDLHRLRVQMKKIRNLMRFLQRCRLIPARSKKDPMKALFSKAGELREAQINLSLFSDLKISGNAGAGFKSFLKRKKKKAAGKLGTALKKFDFKRLKKSRKIIQELEHKISGDKLSQRILVYLSSEEQQIEKLSSAIRAPAGIHTLRKRLKVLETAKDLAGELQATAISGHFLQRIKEINTDIGAIHDLQVFHKTLSTYIQKHPKLEEKDRASLLAVSARLQKQELKDFAALRTRIRSVFISPV